MATPKRFKVSEILDFVNSDETLNVIVEKPIAGIRPLKPDVDEKNSHILPTRGQRGLALILNIVEFDEDVTNEQRRFGSEQDVDYLTDLLTQLNYKIYPLNRREREQKNKSRKDIARFITAFKTAIKNCTTPPASIIVFIGSHGRFPHKIQTSDKNGWLDLYQDIIYEFSHTNCPQLRGKPKIFIVQACQVVSNGDSSSSTIPTSSSPASQPGKITLTSGNETSVEQKLIMEDVYICAATQPGKSARRNKFKGSWFIYVLTYIMMKHALWMKSLQEILTLVTQTLRQIQQGPERVIQVPKQLPPELKKLYFVGSDYTSNLVKNYDRIPTWFEEFMKGNSKRCIVSTPHAQITTEKISENWRHCRFHYVWEEFINFISSTFFDSPSGHEATPDLFVDIVTDCSLDNLKWIVSKVQKIHSTRVLFITSEKEENIAQLKAENVDCRVDLMELDDLSLAFQLKIAERLENRFGIEIKEKELNGGLLVDIISGRQMFRDGLPKSFKYYVERRLRTRNILSDKIFYQSHSSSDLFLIHGIGRSSLSSMVEGGRIGSTTEVLRSPGVTTPAKFMTLDSAKHFDKICEKFGDSTSVHMLRYNGKFHWIRTKGDISFVRECLADSSLQLEKDEDDIYSLFSPNSTAPVCIYDRPGMGKSVLLARIGRGLRTMFPDRIVLFLVLSEFIQEVSQCRIATACEKIKAVVLAKVCVNSLGKYILQSKLASGDICIELLLDGFDEVQTSQVDFGLTILKTIRDELKSIRMWITSRGHYTNILENTLNGLGFNIVPFHPETDQIKFLMLYWSRNTKPGQLNNERLHQFSEYCLSSLENEMNNRNEAITGNPMHCQLTGEVYEEDALEFANANTKIPLPLHDLYIRTLADLYRHLIGRKFEKYRLAGGKLDKNTVLDMHAQLSLKTLFPDHFQNLEGLFRTGQIQMDELMKFGLLESASTTESPRFMHRTIAENVVAWFVVDKLKCEDDWRENMTDFLVDELLRTRCSFPEEFEFSYPMIAYFLNSNFADFKDTIPNSQVKSGMIKKAEISTSVINQLARACAQHDFVHIFLWLDSMDVFSGTLIFKEGFLLLTAKYSSWELLEFGLKKVKESYQFPLDLRNGIIQNVVKRGQFSILESILKEEGFRKIVEQPNHVTELLLHDCVYKTRRNTEQEVKERIEIIKLLHRCNSNLIEKRDVHLCTPLLVEYVHVDILIGLIRLDADIFAQSEDGSTVIHWNYLLSNTHYHSLVKYIFEEKGKEVLKNLLTKTSNSQTPLMDIVSHIDPLPETLKLFKDAGGDADIFNSVSDERVDECGYTVLSFAVVSDREVETLKSLISYGAKPDKAIESGSTLLHLAARYGRLTLLTFLITEYPGLKLNARNKIRQTPLDEAVDGVCGCGQRFEVGLLLHERGGKFKGIVNKKGELIPAKLPNLRGNVDSLLLMLYFFGRSAAPNVPNVSWPIASPDNKSQKLKAGKYQLNFNWIEALLFHSEEDDIQG